ncbi:MAG: desulfoferrodoxin [Bacilli bacterium]|nr:desulfoferrodoxin [Bacilli bacterium]
MNKFLKCKKGGKIFLMVTETEGCCAHEEGGEQPFEHVKALMNDGAVEKHVPVYEIEKNVLHVKVGDVAHPMAEDHFIEWIYVVTEKGESIVHLKPGMEPKADFALLEGEKVLEVYAYCNKHGLWKK